MDDQPPKKHQYTFIEWVFMVMVAIEAFFLLSKYAGLLSG